jgi:putative transposase
MGEEAMKRSKFSEQQIAFILRQAEEGTRVEEVCRKAGISVQTYYRWRKKYGGLMPSEMKRLKQLEEENQRLKRLVADLSLDKEMLQEVVRKKL